MDERMFNILSLLLPQRFTLFKKKNHYLYLTLHRKPQMECKYYESNNTYKHVRRRP